MERNNPLNNSLMIAYIISIFICVFVRLFGEYPMWPTLVAAITTTSWMISLADSNYAVATECRKYSEDVLMYAEAATMDIQRILDAIDKLLVGNDSGIDSTQAGQEHLEHYSDTKKDVLHYLEQHQEIELKAHKILHYAGISEKIDVLLTVVGFVAFFAVLAFEQISKKLIDRQDIMTVMAFGLILLTQYVAAYSKEKRKQAQESYNRFMDGWTALRKSFESEVLHHAD